MGGRQGTAMGYNIGPSRMYGGSSMGSVLSGASSLNVSDLQAYCQSGDAGELKTMINEHIRKKLKIQKRVFETQLKNVKTIAMQEALQFVKNQSEAIQKHLTREHHKLVNRFIEFKERTESRLAMVDGLEREILELTQLKAIESSVKEGIYALDEHNPLQLFDCLVPEMDAHRPLKLPISKEKQVRNNEALLKLKEIEDRMVSSISFQQFLAYDQT